MGYGYGWTETGRMALACDNCGTVGGVRKRTCPYEVTSSSHRSSGRYSMPYCPAPALCAGCYKANGGLRGVHGQSCAEGAASMQATEDAVEAALDAGDLLVAAAWGDWAEGVEPRYVKVKFTGRGAEAELHMPEAMYDPGAVKRLSEYQAMLAGLVPA
jgi:hypothetical protein